MRALRGVRGGLRSRVARVGIRSRATAIATIAVALALAVGGVLLVVLVHNSLVASLDAAGQARARDVAASAAGIRLPRSVASTGEDSSVVQVVDAAGQVVAASPNILGEPPLLPAPPSRRQARVFTRAGLPISGEGQSFRVVVEPATLTGGPGWVYVATSLAQADLSTARLAVLLAVGLPLLLLVVAGSTWRAVGRGLAPVERIRASADAISGARPDDRVPVPPTHDEIFRLAITMNAMLSRLDDAASRQREFVGDASHELRSPLAVLHAEIDVARADADNVLAAGTLERLSKQASRLGDLLEDLLFLARADEGRARLRYVPVDLDELVLAEVRRLRALGATVVLDGPDAARVLGSVSELSRALRNLGDNARAHARTTITLGLHARDGVATLYVANDGPLIPTADRERVFQRFTRLDQARPRTTTEGGGAGLGLAITRQIARRHRGDAVVATTGQTSFALTLPLADPGHEAAVG